MLEERQQAAAAQGERRLRDTYHAALHATYDPLIGAALVHQPRPLRGTFEVALGLGIDVVREAPYLWLADVARALPVPLGWAQAEHPTPGLPPFWHNELSQTSQWLHPIDELVKAMLSALRSPLHPRAAPQVESLLGEDAQKAFDTSAPNSPEDAKGGGRRPKVKGRGEA